jgi:hypothetical protein
MKGLARALLGCCAVLVMVYACGAVDAAAREGQPAVHFDSKGPVTLVSGSAASVTVFNDSGEPFGIRATASLDPLEVGGKALRIPIAANVGTGYKRLAGKTVIPATGQMRLRLSPPATIVAGESGWLTVIATAGSVTAVARRPLAVPVPTPEVDSWTITSVQGLPTRESGGSLDPPIPLSSASGCEALGDPSTVLASGDETVSISSTCEGGYLRLKAGSFGPGTYKGKLEVGTDSVALEIRRTLSIWWPILCIVLGILAAIASQGRVDQGWRWQQRRWLRKLPKDAAKADAKYFVAAREMPWEAYAIEPTIEQEAESLGQRLDEVAAQRPALLRWLPWPEGFMAAEREEIRARIAELAELIEKWPTTPTAFAAALARVHEQPYYVTRAPLLVERALLIVGADGLPIDATELGGRCGEAVAFPDALDVVDDLERFDAYITALENDNRELEPEDRVLRIRARQYERQASATLAGLADSTKVPGEVGPVVEHGAKLASRLSRPEAPAAGLESVQAETAGAPALELAALPLGLVRRATSLLSGGSYPVGQSAVILVTLAVGVLSGLAVLYFEKAWGGSWTDYAAAFVWGYAASTVIDPIVASVRQLGTRPDDSPAKTPTT